jgi:hypothetical protein
MRTVLVILLSAFTIAAAAQEQLDEQTQKRIRTEGSVGGLGKVTPEQKAGAELGAGPHREFRSGPAPRRESSEENSSERDAGRGATRDEALQSGNGRAEPPRP